jgi:molybdopterin-guanine dinucleotide biosynthesis protein A
LEIIKLLFQAAKGHNGAVPIWPNSYLEPLQAVYRTEKLLNTARVVWEKGMMRLRVLLAVLSDVVYVPTERLKKVDPKLESLLNVNSLEDLKLLNSTF